MTDIDALRLIRAVEAADSKLRLVEAVCELANARMEAAIPTLITVLGYNNPGAAIAAVNGLVQLGEAAVQPLLDTLDGYNYGARAWAVHALAEIRDPRSLDVLLDAARSDFSMSVRRSAAKGLGYLRWQLLPVHQVVGAQAQVLETLLQISQDPEWIVRYAVVVSLQEFAACLSHSQPAWIGQILNHLERWMNEDSSLAVRTRLALAQQKLQPLAIVAHVGSATHFSLQEHTPSGNWHSTVEKLYNRKAQERPLQEGDPRKFRDVAVAIAPPIP